jgi:FkbH-like protein
MTSVDWKHNWRLYQAGQQQTADPDYDLRIAIAGTVTVEPLQPHLGGFLLNRRFRPHIVIGPFNQVRQVCEDYAAVLGTADLNVIVLIFRIEDMFPKMLAESLQNPESLNDLLAELKGVVQAVARLRQSFKGTLIVSTPPYPSIPGFDISDLRHTSAGMRVFHTISDFWRSEITAVDRVRLFDLHGLVLQVGMKQALDNRKWLLYRQPYTEAFWKEIGRTIGRMISAEQISPKKCVVLDLDNTLWGGIIGEDKLEGIQLGEDFPGKAYRDFQRYLLYLKTQGVLLAVASKNNEEDACEVFDKHDAMILSRNDISAAEINWDSKVESIKRIASKLNIGIDSLVFVDDNPKEIGEIEERLPGVTCLLVPEELAYLPALLVDTELFDVAEVTDEDRVRTAMMSAENLRQQILESMSEAEFRKSLNLEIDVFNVEKQHLTRVTQLINKTNQFNLTTVRRTQDEVEALANSKSAMVLGMRIKDKYGDYGLVGVSILLKEGTTCIIDTLLMSCRVLGRGAEEAFLRRISESAVSMGCTVLHGKYVSTPKNSLVEDLYGRCNFNRVGDSNEWTKKIGISWHTLAVRTGTSSSPNEETETAGRSV